MLDRALGVLLDDPLEPIVDLVVRRAGPGYEALAVDGRVRFHRVTDGGAWRYEVDDVTGHNPLEDQAVDRFAPLAAELAVRYPSRAANSYPFAYDQIAQLFDHPAAPDLCVLHSAAHNWEDQGGHRGEHGSMDVVQARAPFVATGTGIRRLGMVDRACRLVDVAPTILTLLGAPAVEGAVGPDGRPRPGAVLRRQDGDVLTDLLDGDRPALVLGILWDGTNPNVLYDLAERGEAPNVARLMATGTAFRYGAMASLPTVTLANHTTILTGAHPGHHGILHNAWYDRARGEQIITNSPATWATSMHFLSPEVDSIHSALRRARPDTFTASVNEPADAGAAWSTFDELRAGRGIPRPPRAEELPFSTERFVRPHKDYQWGSRIDHTSVDQAVGILRGAWNGREWPRPEFLWVNFTLTDSAFHAGGPHSDIATSSVHDSDARLGRILEAIDDAGLTDRTAIFLVADHGMEENDPGVHGDWDVALRAAGVDFRDEAYGFLYLGA